MYIKTRSFNKSTQFIFSKYKPKHFVLFGIIILLVFTFGSIAYIARDIPSPGKINITKTSSTVFYDRNDKVLFEMYRDKNRIPVSIQNVPKTLQQATIAIEDKSFYSHKGFSPMGMIRGLISTMFKGQLAGGSTLTQQLVKNVLLTQDRTVKRKIKEFVLSVEIERRFTKDQILEMYLNESPYGGTFWGVQSASVGYFNKDVKELTLVESAFIAGLPQRPSAYSPFIGKDKLYIARTKHVLRRMREDKYITKEQELKASAQIEKMKFVKPKLSIFAPHFVFYVRKLLVAEFGEKILDQGLQIKTTLDLTIQKEVEKIVNEEVEKIKKFNATNGAVVVLDTKTNDILAMVGSYDYNDPDYGSFNTATALRPPGSAIKPITYAAAFEKGYTPSSVIMDVKTEFPDQGGKAYIPVNYDNTFRGPIQLRFALGNSINIPAVKLVAMVGVKTILQKAYDMGISTLEPNTENLNRFGLSITLGGGETRLTDLTNAYATIARGGKKLPLNSFIEVKDIKGKILLKKENIQPQQVLKPEIAFLLSHILSDNNARSAAFGTRSYLSIPGKTVAVKTGTTNDKKDNLTLGFTNDITIGVWVGNNDNTPMNQKIASGVTGASPIWNRTMTYLLKKYKDGIIKPTGSIIAIEVDSFLGGLPKEGVPNRSEYYIKGTEPQNQSQYYKKLKISRSTGKLANEVEIKSGDFDEKEYIVITESDPISKDGKNRWQDAIDEWVNNQSDERFKAPKEKSSGKSDEVLVSIKNPSNMSQINSNSFTLDVKAVSVESIEVMEIFINNSLYKSVRDTERIEESINLSNGIYTIQVKAKNKNNKTGEATIKIGINQSPIENTQVPTIIPSTIPTTTFTPTPQETITP